MRQALFVAVLALGFAPFAYAEDVAQNAPVTERELIVVGTPDYERLAERYEERTFQIVNEAGRPRVVIDTHLWEKGNWRADFRSSYELETIGRNHGIPEGRERRLRFVWRFGGDPVRANLSDPGSLPRPAWF